MLLLTLFAPGAAVISHVPLMIGKGIDMAQYDPWDLSYETLFDVLNWGANSRSDEFPTMCLVEDMDDSAGCATAYSINVETFDTTTAAQDALSRGTEIGVDASVPIPDTHGGGSVSAGADYSSSSAVSQNRGTAQSGAIGETIARNGCVQIAWGCIGTGTDLSLHPNLLDALNNLMDWGYIDDTGTDINKLERWRTQIMRRFGTDVVIKTNHGAAIKKITSTDANNADAAQEAASSFCANVAAEDVLQNYLNPAPTVEGTARNLDPEEAWVRRLSNDGFYTRYQRVMRTGETTEGEQSSSTTTTTTEGGEQSSTTSTGGGDSGGSQQGADLAVNMCSTREQSSTNSWAQEQFDQDCVAVGGNGDGQLAYRVCLDGASVGDIAEFLNGGFEKDTNSVTDMAFIQLVDLYQLMATPPPRSEIEYHNRMLDTWKKATEYHLCLERNDPEDPVWTWETGDDGKGTCTCNRYCGNGLEGVGGFLDPNTCSCVCMGDENHGFRGEHCENSYGLCEPGAGTGNPSAANECGAKDGACESSFNTYNCAPHENCCITSFAGACCPFGYSCGRVSSRNSDGTPATYGEGCSWNKCNACVPPDNMVGLFMASKDVPGWMLRVHEEMDVIYPHEPTARGVDAQPQSYTTPNYEPAFDFRKGGRLTFEDTETEDMAGRLEQQFFAKAREEQLKQHRESREERIAKIMNKIDELVHDKL